MFQNTSEVLDITVVTPAYNRAHLIGRALDSVFAQQVPPAQVIVVDDASTDGTPEVVRQWAAEHRLPVTVDALSSNHGPAFARNRGIELADTEFVAFLDSDDEYLPNTLLRLVRPLLTLSAAVLSFSDATVVTPSRRKAHALFRPRINLETETKDIGERSAGILKMIDPTSTLLMASIIPTSATCFRRRAALAAGLMPVEFRSGEDWLFWLRLSQHGDFVCQLDDLVLHHRHDENLTHARAYELVAREKLRGLLALRDGTVGVELNNSQRKRVTGFIEQQLRDWRYHLSRLGISPYMKGLSAEWLRHSGGLGKNLLADPKSVLRAILSSLH